jgi:hypothetical protein
VVIHLLVTRAEHFRTRLLNFLLSKFLLPRPRPKRVFVEVEPSENNGTLQFWQERHEFSPCVDEKPAGRWFPATSVWVREETSPKGRPEPAAKTAKKGRTWECEWCSRSEEELPSTIGKSTGPNGPDTLCTACSVHFKKGATVSPHPPRNANGTWSCEKCGSSFEALPGIIT